MIIGNFNAKEGSREDGKDLVGKFGLENETNGAKWWWVYDDEMYIMNIFIKKLIKNKCTWRSPDWSTKNEIDYIMGNKEDIFQDLEILGKFNTGSDHKIVRAKLQTDEKMERWKMAKSHKREILRKLLEGKRYTWKARGACMYQNKGEYWRNKTSRWIERTHYANPHVETQHSRLEWKEKWKSIEGNKRSHEKTVRDK